VANIHIGLNKMRSEPASLLLSVRAKAGDRRRATIASRSFHVDAALGRGGISAFKREGDGATPRAEMRVLSGFWRADRLARPATRLSMCPIRADMGWCDAPFHAAYNRPVRLPFGASHETMRRDDHLYDIVLVLDWNVSSRRAGAGSAIFMHLARPGYLPTEGCIAVAGKDMIRLLRIIGPGTRVRVEC
jgi:L,D-peptidoglycan transpeptidase YkuD (ErfK/YbiS/YcfS/YnhG family)